MVGCIHVKTRLTLRDAKPIKPIKPISVAPRVMLKPAVNRGPLVYCCSLDSVLSSYFPSLLFSCALLPVIEPLFSHHLTNIMASIARALRPLARSATSTPLRLATRRSLPLTSIQRYVALT